MLQNGNQTAPLVFIIQLEDDGIVAYGWPVEQSTSASSEPEAHGAPLQDHGTAMAPLVKESLQGIP